MSRRKFARATHRTKSIHKNEGEELKQAVRCIAAYIELDVNLSGNRLC